ncbi:MAG: ATP synthase F0 subunit B [Myxococcota bacterium]|jgi:F-type H+-transporting ATPase subunit b|nr:ATP synthase F0 subunit B [Myxococcota bacterium]
MEIDPILIGLQLIPFLIALVGLHFIIYKPMLNYLEEREQSVVQDRAAATGLQEQVQQKVAALEDKLTVARAEANAERARLREQIREEEQTILERARERADAMVAEARAEIAGEREAASRTLRAETEALSRDIARSVLGRPV